MSHIRTNNNKINRLHERCLRLIYNDKKSSFKDLLEKGGSVSIHHRNLRRLAEELFKVFKGLSPVIFAEAFPVRQRSQYNMRNYSYFAMPRAKTVNHGLESLSYIGSKLFCFVFFSFLSGFSFTDIDISKDSRGREGTILFHSTTSTRSRTFRHLFATLHVR